MFQLTKKNVVKAPSILIRLTRATNLHRKLSKVIAQLGASSAFLENQVEISSADPQALEKASLYITKVLKEKIVFASLENSDSVSYHRCMAFMGLKSFKKRLKQSGIQLIGLFRQKKLTEVVLYSISKPYKQIEQFMSIIAKIQTRIYYCSPKRQYQPPPILHTSDLFLRDSLVHYFEKDFGPTFPNFKVEPHDSKSNVVIVTSEEEVFYQVQKALASLNRKFLTFYFSSNLNEAELQKLRRDIYPDPFYGRFQDSLIFCFQTDRLQEVLKQSWLMKIMTETTNMPDLRLTLVNNKYQKQLIQDIKNIASRFNFSTIKIDSFELVFQTLCEQARKGTVEQFLRQLIKLINTVPVFKTVGKQLAKARPVEKAFFFKTFELMDQDKIYELEKKFKRKFSQILIIVLPQLDKILFQQFKGHQETQVCLACSQSGEPDWSRTLSLQEAGRLSRMLLCLSKNKDKPSMSNTLPTMLIVG